MQPAPGNDTPIPTSQLHAYGVEAPAAAQENSNRAAGGPHVRTVRQAGAGPLPGAVPGCRAPRRPPVRLSPGRPAG